MSSTDAATTIAADTPVGELELVHTFNGPMPTGIAVSQAGRVFVSYPKWGDDVPATITEIRDGEAVPYPDQATNSPSGEDDERAFVSVQSVIVDPADRLWALDPASPMFQPVRYQGGEDLREKPYTLFRVRIDADPVRLR